MITKLVYGRLRVLSGVILATLQPGDYIGEMSMIDNQPHSATVEAEIQTDVLVLGRKEFTRCLPENATMAYAVMQGLVRRLRHADQKIGSLALMGVYGRVANVLLESAAADEGRLIIREKLSRQDIAKMVGASREMVSRVMKDLEERGFIQTHLPEHPVMQAIIASDREAFLNHEIRIRQAALLPRATPSTPVSPRSASRLPAQPPDP